MRLADLFLDTNPYNAHTTALDAVWAGLPVLTYTGSSFVSRMAAGVLSSIGLTELVATSLGDYESRAVAFGLDRQRLSQLRAQLLDQRTRSSAPYDSKVFSGLLEHTYTAMFNRAAAGEPPAPMSVDPHGQTRFGSL
jgi:predicted O-linked N-acetylglucosamine transferase (SPINDLY family)